MHDTDDLISQTVGIYRQLHQVLKIFLQLSSWFLPRKWKLFTCWEGRGKVT